MPYHYILANIMADIPGALTVTFLDGEGETIDYISAGVEGEEVKIHGAYQGIFIANLSRKLENPIDFLYYRHDKGSTAIITVGKEYLLVTVSSKAVPPARMQYVLKKAQISLEAYVL